MVRMAKKYKKVSWTLLTPANWRVVGVMLMDGKVCVSLEKRIVTTKIYKWYSSVSENILMRIQIQARIKLILDPDPRGVNE